MKKRLYCIFLVIIISIFFLPKELNKAEIEKGVKVGVLIFSDESDYPNEKNNIGEQLTVKVPLASMEDYDSFQPMITTCEIVDVEKATVYGEYRNQLSIIAKVVEVDEVIDL